MRVRSEGRRKRRWLFFRGLFVVMISGGGARAWRSGVGGWGLGDSTCRL